MGEDECRKMRNLHLAEMMFPKLGGRVKFPNGWSQCECIAHAEF